MEHPFQNPCKIRFISKELVPKVLALFGSSKPEELRILLITPAYQP